jgi:hypothetical protein
VARKPFYRKVREVRGDFYRFLRVLCDLGGVKLDFEKTMIPPVANPVNSTKKL